MSPFKGYMLITKRLPMLKIFEEQLLYDCLHEYNTLLKFSTVANLVLLKVGLALCKLEAHLENKKNSQAGYYF